MSSRPPASTSCSTIAASVRVSMFADLELIGIPHRITVGERGLKDGKVEYQARRDAQPTAVAIDDIVAFVRARLAH